MANALFEKGREGFLDGTIDWDNNTIKAILVDLADFAHTKVPTAATNATPIVVTITSHGWTTGDVVSITGITGNTNANGIRRITSTGANTFSLQDPNTGADIAGNGTFGGTSPTVTNLTVPDNLDDVAVAARVAISSAMTSMTVTNGVADAADVTWSSVTGDPSEAIIIYKDTGVESTSRLIAFIDVATGLPVTPNGGNIIAQWDNGQNRIFKL